MKFCRVVPEICRGQVHGPRKERKRIIIIKIKIKNNKSPKLCLGDLIITRYDYNLTIMKSPKPAIDTIYSHIKF